jgi:hypothetical protein
MIVGVPKESFPGERRVALVPATRMQNTPGRAARLSHSGPRCSKPPMSCSKCSATDRTT